LIWNFFKGKDDDRSYENAFLEKQNELEAAVRNAVADLTSGQTSTLEERRISLGLISKIAAVAGTAIPLIWNFFKGKDDDRSYENAFLEKQHELEAAVRNAVADVSSGKTSTLEERRISLGLISKIAAVAGTAIPLIWNFFKGKDDDRSYENAFLEKQNELEAAVRNAVADLTSGQTSTLEERRISLGLISKIAAVAGTAIPLIWNFFKGKDDDRSYENAFLEKQNELELAARNLVADRAAGI